MPASSLCERLSAIGPILLPVLLDAAIKGLAILSLTALAVLAMRRASAAARHLVWLLGTLSLLILPILSAALPAWHILPQWANNVAVLADSVPVSAGALTPDVPRIAPDNQDLPNESPMQAEPLIPAQVAAAPVRVLSPLHVAWQTWVLFAWLAGSALSLGYVALGFASLWWLQRRSSRITAGGWPILLRQLCDQLGFRRPVKLLSSPDRTMPMTWGLWRTRLLLPEDSTSWSNDQRRTVLLHELAHAKRWDCLTQLVVQLACAGYWFNPLLWLAWTRMQTEREEACDDLVLSAGTRPSAYAEQLLHIASEMPAVRYSAAAIAMARPSKLEGRLLAILDVTRNRRGLTRGGVLIAAAAALALVIPMACMKAAGQEHQTPYQPAAQANAGIPATEPAASNNTARARHFVMLVIAPDGGMTFQGTATNWDKLPALLEQVPDRSHTVLCLAWTSDQVTVGQPNEGRAGNLAQQFGFEYLSIVGEHPLGSTGGPDKMIEDAKGTAGGGAEPLVQPVNKALADFPQALDLSTPQSAWAAWQRASVAKDGKAEAELSWRKLDPEQEQRWWQQQERDDPAGLSIYTAALAKSKLIEVWVYRGGLAETISYLPFPDGKGRDPYSLRSFGLIDGSWKNLGEDRCGSLDEARENIRAKLPRMWSDFQETKSSSTPSPATAPAAVNQEAGKTITLYVHNGVMQMRMGDNVIEAARIEIDPVGGPRLVAEADGNQVRLLRGGDEKDIAALGLRIEIAPDGQIAAKGGIIRHMQNALDAQGK